MLLYAHVQELEPRALYVHCYSHAFNLSASKMLKQCALLKDAMLTSHKAINTLFTPKRTHIIRRIKENLYLATTCHIRWTIHADALDSIINKCTVLQSTWDDAKYCRARYIDEGKNSRRYVSNEYVPLPGRDHGGRATTETRRELEQNSAT